MSGSSFGRLFRLVTFGESHGPAIGGVVEGCPAGLPLNETDLQQALDRRRPGKNRFTTQRREPDRCRILSGVFEGRTTGTPIGLMIENTDQRSNDYGAIRELFRPGHADYTYWRKYGVRDWRGGGRASARETAVRVAAGAIAQKLLFHQLGVSVRGAIIQMGSLSVDRAQWDWDEREKNPFFSPDSTSVDRFAKLLDHLRETGDSIGAVVEVTASGVPAGWGEPVFDRLDADLAKGLMSINAVKGVEIGAGMGAAVLRGSENGDEMVPGDLKEHSKEHPDNVQFLSNHAGGILGGISSGQEIIARMAVKPTSSIRIPKKTVDLQGNPQEIVTCGRHDPCVGIRAVPVAEAMMAIVLVDHFLRQRGCASIEDQ